MSVTSYEFVDKISPFLLWGMIFLLGTFLIFIVVLVLMAIWNGCKQFIVRPLTEEEQKEERKHKRKPVRPFQHIMNIGNDSHLYREMSTDIVYIITYSFHGGTSVNYLVDVDGKPLLYKNWKENMDKLDNEDNEEGVI